MGRLALQTNVQLPRDAWAPPYPLPPTPPPPPPPPRRQVEAGQLSRVAALVRGVMEGVAGFAALRVPLRVRLAAGPSWGELEELELDSQGYRIEMK